jgi:hypothetical protein
MAKPKWYYRSRDAGSGMRDPFGLRDAAGWNGCSLAICVALFAAVNDLQGVVEKTAIFWFRVARRK